MAACWASQHHPDLGSQESFTSDLVCPGKKSWLEESPEGTLWEIIWACTDAEWLQQTYTKSMGTWLTTQPGTSSPVGQTKPESGSRRKKESELLVLAPTLTASGLIQITRGPWNNPFLFLPQEKSFRLQTQKDSTCPCKNKPTEFVLRGIRKGFPKSLSHWPHHDGKILPSLFLCLWHQWLLWKWECYLWDKKH